MTKAIILAAGEGKRLRPLTNDKPKCCVKLAGTSLIERQLTTLRASGITDIHIVSGYLADKLRSLGLSISINERYSETNMVESLFAGLKFIKECNEDMLICYGDIVYSSNNLDALLSNEHDMSIMVDKSWRQLWSLRLDNPLDDAETLKLDQVGNITELGKKPSSYEEIQGQYTGLIKIKKHKIKELVKFYQDLDRDVLYEGKSFENMYMTTFIQLLIDSGWQINASNVNNGWLEVDTVSDLNLYEDLMRKGRITSNYLINY